MYPLFETICLKNGKIQHAKWHQWRYENAYLKLYGKHPKEGILEKLTIPPQYNNGLFKLRISYNKTHKKVEFENYIIKEITSLKIVEDNEIIYNLKYTDRSKLNQLYTQKTTYDDILIIKNGWVTDTFFCNIVFYDNSRWITPSTPLLGGTARARLIESNTISVQDIHLKDLKKFKSFKLINAMRDFTNLRPISIDNIKG